MPGVNLDLDLPSLSDTFADIVAKTVVALDAIQDDLAGDVTPSEMNMNTALSMGGNHLTNVGALTLVDGNVPALTGSLFYDGVDFFAISPAGTVQLTLEGAVNVAGTGGITGDYGLGDETVSYDSGTSDYSFTSEPGTFADLLVADVVLHNTTGGSVRLGVDDSITTDRTVMFSGLPTSGTSILVYNATTSTIEAGDLASVEDLGVERLTVTEPILHGDHTLLVPAFAFSVQASGTATYSVSETAVTKTGGTGTVSVQYYFPLPCGTFVKTVVVSTTNFDAFSGSVSIAVARSVDNVGGSSGSAFTGHTAAVVHSTVGTQSNTLTTSTGLDFFSADVGTTQEAVGARSFIFTGSFAGTGDSIGLLKVTYNRTAD